MQREREIEYRDMFVYSYEMARTYICLSSSVWVKNGSVRVDDGEEGSGDGSGCVCYDVWGKYFVYPEMLLIDNDDDGDEDDKDIVKYEWNDVVQFTAYLFIYSIIMAATVVVGYDYYADILIHRQILALK